MNHARLLITKIVDDQHIKTPLDSGLDKEWLSDPDSRAIFDGKDREAYLFILGHFKKYDQVPDREQMLDQFDPSYEFTTTERNMASILDDIEKLFIRGMTDIAIGDLMEAFEGDRVHDAIDIARELVAKVEMIGRPDHSNITFNEVATDLLGFLDREKVKGILTKIPAVDEHFGGMRPGQLITLLGRNKGMKTWLLLKLAVTAWDQGASSMIFSVELSEDQLIERLAAIFAEVHYERIRKGTLSTSDREKLQEAAEAVCSDEVAIGIARDILSFTIDDIRKVIDKHHPDIVFIDGFYFMRDKETGKTAVNWEAHENLAADLKRLAEKTGTIIVTTTQVQEKQHNDKAGVEGRSMMGGTGLIKASDLVLGVDKPERVSAVQKLNQVANREGEPTDSAIKWDFETMTFEEVDLASIVEEDDDVDRTRFAM